ncbi:hypothetical protein YC2023_068614 [Brassica napus]
MASSPVGSGMNPRVYSLNYALNSAEIASVRRSSRSSYSKIEFIIQGVRYANHDVNVTQTMTVNVLDLT